MYGGLYSIKGGRVNFEFKFKAADKVKRVPFRSQQLVTRAGEGKQISFTSEFKNIRFSEEKLVGMTAILSLCD